MFRDRRKRRGKRADAFATPTDPIGSDRDWDVILVGDAFYEKPLADSLLPWLETLSARGAKILLGDPGR